MNSSDEDDMNDVVGEEKIAIADARDEMSRVPHVGVMLWRVRQAIMEKLVLV
jgi:hypothetical protein